MEKLFSDFDAEERKAWIADFQTWTATQLPVLEDASCRWGGTEREQMEHGLHLINSFLFCRSFVTDSLRFRDYERRMKPMRRCVDQVMQEVKDAVSVQAIDLTDPKLLVRHRGRPTKLEQKARALEAERKRKEEESEHPLLFDTETITPTPAAFKTASGTIGYGSLLHLDQWKWLMSTELQEAVDSIRTLRSEAGSAAEKAKALAEAGLAPEKVSVYAKEAAEKTEAYEVIYERVDMELATVYVRLKEDSTYKKQMTKRKVKIPELCTLLRPYYDRQPEGFKERVIQQIMENDPRQAAQRKKLLALKAQVDAIRKYLLRTDKPNTAVRIRTMTERIKQLEKLIGKEEAAPYYKVLEAAKANPYTRKNAKRKTEENQ